MNSNIPIEQCVDIWLLHPVPLEYDSGCFLAGFICGYRLYSDEYEVPFTAEVISHPDGRAKLKVKPGVRLGDYLRKKFKFEIAAFDCGSPTLHSKK